MVIELGVMIVFFWSMHKIGVLKSAFAKYGKQIPPLLFHLPPNPQLY